MARVAFKWLNGGEPLLEAGLKERTAGSRLAPAAGAL